MILSEKRFLFSGSCSNASADVATAIARDALAPSLRRHPVIACMVPCDVNLAFRVAHRCDRLGEVGHEASVRQADGAGTVDGAFSFPRQHRDQRIGHATAAEKRHLNTADIMLVDKDRHMAILASSPRASRIGAPSDVATISPMCFSRIPTTTLATASSSDDGRGRGIESVGRSEQGREFPVGEVARKDQGWLAAITQPLEALGGAGRVVDVYAVFRIALA